MVETRAVSAFVVEEHLRPRSTRSCFPKVEERARSVRTPGHQEASSTDVSRRGMDNPKRKRRGHGSVDGIAALL